MKFYRIKLEVTSVDSNLSLQAGLNKIFVSYHSNSFNIIYLTDE